MIEKPEMKMEVVSIRSSCSCNGHPAGTVGYISFIEHNDQFMVNDRSSDATFWHCVKCVTKFK